MGGLDGLWDVRRTGGALPPLLGVRKRIAGTRGETLVGPLPVPFDVRGRELRYRPPFGMVVDVLAPDGDGWTGRATVFGRTVGAFELRRRGRAPLS